MANLVILDPAQRELEEIAQLHMNLVGPNAARNITNLILDTLSRLEMFPLSGHIPQDKELVEAFIQEAKQTMPEAKVTYAVTADIHDKFDVIINASPVGMFPKVDACPVSDELIDGADYFFDVIYNPTKTLFLRKALAQGKVAKGGAAMLVLQAVRAHEIWNGDSYTDKQIESIICDMEERIDEQNQTK